MTILRYSLRSVFVGMLLLIAACPAFALPASFGGGSLIAPHVRTWAFTLKRPGGATTVWLYLPDPLPRKKIPCVLVAPAGSPLLWGMDLGDGDRAEQIPYAQAGMATVAYSVSGPGEDQGTIGQNIGAARQFMQSDAGVIDEMTALSYALHHFKEIDPARVYSAGHSSAATLSLLAAEYDPRIKACIAYAPATNVMRRAGHAATLFDRFIPGYKHFIVWSSPVTNTARLKCPVFIFHADDDTNVPTSDNALFVTQLQETNPRVTFVRVAQGGHYPSMIQQGIPMGIAWLKKLSAPASRRTASHRARRS